MEQKYEAALESIKDFEMTRLEEPVSMTESASAYNVQTSSGRYSELFPLPDEMIIDLTRINSAEEEEEEDCTRANLSIMEEDKHSQNKSYSEPPKETAPSTEELFFSTYKSSKRAHRKVLRGKGSAKNESSHGPALKVRGRLKPISPETDPNVFNHILIRGSLLKTSTSTNDPGNGNNTLPGSKKKK